MNDFRAEREAALGVQPIAELVAERATLVERVAHLHALYGSFGTWDAHRKMKLAGIKGALRAQWTRDGIKPTEGMLDDAAHAHPDYAEFIIESTKQRAEWMKLDDAITGINDVILRDAALARHETATARLG